MGLAMLEKSFLDDALDSSTTKSGDRSSRKRRKVDGPTPPPMLLPEIHDDDDDDDEGYFPIVVQGKKAKLGTGYAGDAREDVRFVPFLPNFVAKLLAAGRLRASLRH